MANRKHGDREQQGRVSLPRYLTHEDKGRATPQELFSHDRALLIGPSWAHGGKREVAVLGDPLGVGFRIARLSFRGLP
jgi:hypothetical protein